MINSDQESLSDERVEGRSRHVGHGSVDECERCGQSGEWLTAPIDGGRGEAAAYHGYSPGNLCRGCHMELLPDPEVLYTELLDREFTFYFGAASGSSRKALKKAEESHVMVSYATKMNGRIGAEDVHFTDCGGAPDSFKDGDLAEKGDYVTPDAEYVEYVQDVDADLWTLRDYPCEDEVLQQHDRTVAEHQGMTTERHRSLLNLAEDAGVDGQPVSVLQGQTLDEYLSHYDQMRDAGVLTDYVGIGSVCRRHAEDEIQKIVTGIRDELPERYRLHAFGVKIPVLEKPGVLNALSSADSCAYDYGLMMEAIYGGARYTWKPILQEYLAFKENVGDLLANYDDVEQQSLGSYGTSCGTGRGCS